MKILFLQGAGKNAYKEDKKLVNNLQELLGPAYKISYPKMPHEEAPEYKFWRAHIAESLQEISDNKVILVGHSLGGSILLKYITEHKLEKTVAGIFLISIPYWGGDKDWEYEGFRLAENFAEKMPDAPVFFYHSTDDDIVPFAHMHLYKDKLPNSTCTEIEGRGHQLNNDLSEVAKDIEKFK